MENWRVQQLRFSGFFQQGDPAGLLEEIWKLISEDSPETDESRPREGFRHLSSVDKDGATVEAILMPGRFDVVRSASVAAAEILPLVDLGEARPQIGSFTNIISAMLQRLGNVSMQRIAFGAVLIQPAAGREEAYYALQDLLPVTLDPSRSQDFMFQINHPEEFQFGLETLRLNRLSKWSAMMQQRFMVAASEGVAPVARLTSGDHFVRCEVDNSTPANRILPLPAEEIVPIFVRLVELADVTAMGERHAES